MPPKKTTSGVKKKTAPPKAPRAATSRVLKDSTKTTVPTKRTSPDTEKKRKLEDDNDEPQPKAIDASPPKRSKKSHNQSPPPRAVKASAPASATVPAINTRPSQTLDVFVFGDGSFGELGLGNKKHDGKSPTDVKRPRLNHLLAERDVVQVSCGGMHAVALTKDNKILTWGVNDEKALGRETNWEGDVEDDDDEEGLDPMESTPREVDMSAIKHQFVQVAATNSASFVLTDVGTVYGWGTFRGDDGVIGFTPDIKLQATPLQVSDLQGITSLAAGPNHMLALDKDGKIFTWGSGGQFQLGRKLVGRHSGPKAMLLPSVCGRFTKKSHAVKIAAGTYHSFYIDNHGKVWSWGLNNFAQTGHIDAGGIDSAVVPGPKVIQDLRDHEITHIEGGQHHSVACTATGEVFTWGRIDSHQVGLREELFTEDNTIFDERGRPRILSKPTIIPDLSASYVAAGSDTTFAISRTGEAYSWGFSGNHQAGQGTEDDIEVPTLVKSSSIAGKELIWAGIGGQFSMVASVHKS